MVHFYLQIPNDSQFKAKVALEAIKNQKTIDQIASEYGIHPNQVGKWKKQLLESLPKVFINRKTEAENEPRLIHTVRGVGYALRKS